MKTFFKTVATVTVFSICEKFLGFLYRIFMSRTIGAEGIGLYEVALSIFALILTICCSGVPITVSRLITKYKAQKNLKRESNVISSGLFIALITTLPICLIFIIFGNNLSFLFADKRSYTIFIILLPGIVFTSLYSILRGVFWGNKDFLPYSIIELLEEICMIIIGVILISNSNSVLEGTIGASIAVLISFIFSFTLATITFFIRKNRLSNPFNEIRPLLHSAVPITAMRTATSFASSLISIILPMRLISAGLTESQALSSFGSAVGQAIPILFVPSTIIGSFTLVLIPEISDNYYRNDTVKLKNNIEKAIKTATIIACLFIPIFFVCGEEIGVLIFNSVDCGKYLTCSSFLVVFISLSNITTSILNSIGLERKTLLYYAISSVFLFASIWFLPFVCGIYSLLIGFSAVYVISTILNIILLNKTCVKKPIYIRFSIGSFLSSIPTILFGLMLEKLLLPLCGTFLTLVLCAMLMVAFHLLLHIALNLVSIDLFKVKLKRNLFKKKSLG